MKFRLSLLFLVFISMAVFGDIKVSLGEYLLDDDPYRECLKVGKDGKIYIAEKQTYSIRVFSKNGNYLYSFGGKGEGPGQFKRWYGVYDIYEKGDIYQVDFFNGNKRITQFSPEGKVIRSFPLKVAGNKGGIAIFALKDGNFVVGLTDGLIIEKKGRLYFMGSKIAFSIVDSQGNIKEKLSEDTLFLDFSDETQRAWPRIPYPAYICSSYYPFQNKLIFQKSDSDTLNILDLKTRQITQIANGFRKQPVDDSDLNAWIEEQKEINPKFKLFEPFYKKFLKYGKEYELYKPIVDRIFFNPEGEFFAASFDKRGKKYYVKKFSDNNKFIKSSEFRTIPSAIEKNKLYYLIYNEEEDNYWLEIKKRSGKFF